MTDRKPLMPKATAVWLVAEHLADLRADRRILPDAYAGDQKHRRWRRERAEGHQRADPVTSGQLTREEIARGEAEAEHKLRLAEAKVHMPEQSKKKTAPRYTPVSRRHDRPNAVLWLLRNHPELKESQIIRLVGTTKPTIAQIRDRTHWNSPNLVPQDPVTLGICSQTDLDAEVKKAARRVERERKETMKDLAKSGTLLPTEETTRRARATDRRPRSCSPRSRSRARKPPPRKRRESWRSSRA